MALVLALSHEPAGAIAFDRYCHDIQIPIAQRIPGLRSYSIHDGLVQALASPEGLAAAAHARELV